MLFSSLQGEGEGGRMEEEPSQTPAGDETSTAEQPAQEQPMDQDS